MNRVLTSPAHPSGTDRAAEVAQRPEFAGFDIVLNVQGDEPFITEAAVRGALGPEVELFGGAVTFVDSNVRAMALTDLNAKANGVPNYELVTTATLGGLPMSSFDVALANPPYYADFRIAELFLNAAHRSLRPGGLVLVVTKHPGWYEEFMPLAWSNIEHWPSKRYHLIAATRP